MIIKKLQTAFVFAVLLTAFACNPKISSQSNNAKDNKTPDEISKTKPEEADYYILNYLKYEDYIYNDSIKSILFHQNH